ncbi:MAG: FecR domain-containing protein [Bacteroidia bacterium]
MSNEQENTYIDELLAKYISGETNALENAEALSWINTSEENKKYFDGLKEIWNNSSSTSMQFDTDAAWNRMKTRMNVNVPVPKVSRPIYFRVAAGVALFILLGSLAYFINGNNKQPEMKSLVALASEDPKEAKLPDGSIVSINRNSELTYPEYFKGETREVNLKGEVFFNISHDAEHPFIIHTGTLDIKVVGTSFNVNAFPETDSVRVSVQTGKVKCYIGKDTVVLVPGDVAVYHKTTHELVKSKEDDPNTTAYRNRIFNFRNTRLADAIKSLNNAYGSNIIIKSDIIRECRLNVEFKNESLDNILDVIKESFGVSVQRTGLTILLDGKGCLH